MLDGFRPHLRFGAPPHWGTTYDPGPDPSPKGSCHRRETRPRGVVVPFRYTSSACWVRWDLLVGRLQIQLIAGSVSELDKQLNMSTEIHLNRSDFHKSNS